MSVHRWGVLLVLPLVVAMPALGSHYLSQAQVRKIFNFKRLTNVNNYAYREGDVSSNGQMPSRYHWWNQTRGEVHSPFNYVGIGHTVGKKRANWTSDTTISSGTQFWQQMKAGTYGSGYSRVTLVTLPPSSGHRSNLPKPKHPGIVRVIGHLDLAKYQHIRVVQMGRCVVAGQLGTQYKVLGGWTRYYCINDAHGFEMSAVRIFNPQSKVNQMMPPSIQAEEAGGPFFIMTQIGGVPPIPIPAH